MATINFKGGLPHNCTCPICDQALREPIRLNCDHFYCKVCFESSDRIANCVVCQTIIQQELSQYDKEKHKEIQSLPVFCSFELSGCPWQGELREVHKHVEMCNYKFTTCPTCGRNFSSSDIERHRLRCQQSQTRCTFCNKAIRDSDMERHLKSCLKVIVSCPFQCGLNDRPREEIDLHRPNCPNVDNVCPFVPFGCTFAGDKKSIQKHLSDEPVKHLMFLCDEISDLKETYDMMERDLSSHNIRQENIMDMAETCREMFGPQLIWKIDNIQQRTNEAKSGTTTTIFSEPFMTHRYGYKMMACACLFGDGSSAGRSLSLYVLILKGEFDPTLEWPFNRTIKITLLDQNPSIENRVDITYIIDPRKLKANEKFLARPRGDRNAAFGSQSFCSLSILQNYIKDDKIYVKVEIDRCQTVSAVMHQSDEEKKKYIESLRQHNATPVNLSKSPIV